MTSRERWLAVLNGRQPDCLPTDYRATPEFHAKFKTALGITDDEQLWQRLGIDYPAVASCTWKLKYHPDDPLGDRWGIRHEKIDYGTGSYGEPVYHPLASVTNAAEVHAFHWPDPDDFEVAPYPTATASYRIVLGGNYEPFLLYCAMRGMELAFEDLILEPAIVEAALGHIFDIHYEVNRRLWKAYAGKIDFMYLAEDLGGQTGPLFSLETYRRFLLPGQKKMADLARSFGVRIFYHTDGAARIFMPDLVHEVGIDALNPLQWRCPGMELPGLVRDYGDRLIFHGGIDNQQTLPFGTTDDVRREVREIRAIMRDYRWICAPCHNIQNVSPVENVLAMYEEARS